MIMNNKMGEENKEPVLSPIQPGDLPEKPISKEEAEAELEKMAEAVPQQIVDMFEETIKSALKEVGVPYDISHLHAVRYSFGLFVAALDDISSKAMINMIFIIVRLINKLKSDEKEAVQADSQNQTL